MELLLGCFVELLGELVIQIVAQVLIDGVIRILTAPFREGEDLGPFPGLFAYLGLGLVLGWLSLFAFPRSFLVNPTLRVVNLVAAPLAVGAATEAWGRHRRRHDRSSVRFESFLFGLVFAFGVAAVRYFFAATAR
ncbi:MAG: hypothetical protein HYZ53_00375 [Planctomycetes bacterium]|nr:hypothetical protein [Planctomycetota bacterium]